MKWQMQYYVDKCKLTCIEKNIPDFTYTMISCNLAIRTQKQELRVLCNSTKTAAQCSAEITKNKQRSKIFISLHASALLILFAKYLRSAALGERTASIS